MLIIYNSSVSIALRIVTKSFLHIGTGMGNQLVDRTVMKDGSQLLYIPASSLKGKVRNICEGLAGASALQVCNPHGTLQCRSEPFCIICRIFGSKFRENRLLFDNAYMVEESREIYKDRFKVFQTMPLTHIKLNRYIKTAERGHLFQSEYGVPEITYMSRIRGLLPSVPLDGEEGRDSYELILLLAGLKMLDFIGGNKSRGCGKIEVTTGYINGDGKFKENFIKINDIEREPEDFLSQIEELTLYDDVLELLELGG